MSTAHASTGDTSQTDAPKYTNRLIRSHDPYLLLHAHNPVDWYPWGPEALAAARREHKPIFLSVGYSTCYWCHVAEREIYSNPAIAKLMNEWFINIKVDREQRPDIDRVYMLATQIISGGGGWPNNVFMTPELKPFFAGSYFPPQDQGGRPGFPQVLKSMHQAWTDDRPKVLEVADQVYRALQQVQADATAGKLTPDQWQTQALQQAAGRFDVFNGGFGDGATKFPQAPLLSMLLDADTQDHHKNALKMAVATLQAMAEGGVMDQLAGGFHRYSTDPGWDVPHFEKMLYDNAQLLRLYARAYAITKQPLFRQTALRTAHYLTTEMRAPDGGFYSAQDAEVGSVEGASYVWTRSRIETLLGAVDSKRWFDLYTLMPMPHSFAGQPQVDGGVLRLDRSRAQVLAENHQMASAVEALAPLRKKLLTARNQRPQPARDEKIVTATNALAILGFTAAAHALDDKALLQVAIRTADWEWSQAFDPNTGLLRHQFFHGHAGDDGFLDDYALLAQAYLALHAATGDALWLNRAQQVIDAMLKRFTLASGALATTWDHADLLVAPPAEGDSVQPSGQSAAIVALLELAAATDKSHYAVAANRALTPLAGQVAAQASGWGALLGPLSRPKLKLLLASADHQGAGGQGLPNSADQVQAAASLSSTANGAALVVSIAVAPGYHINANPASDADLISTELTVAGHDGLRVNYPPAQQFKAPFAPQGIAVYSGKIQFHVQLPAMPSALLQLRLRVQACNDQYCLTPATLHMTAAASSTK